MGTYFGPTTKLNPQIHTQICLRLDRLWKKLKDRCFDVPAAPWQASRVRGRRFLAPRSSARVHIQGYLPFPFFPGILLFRKPSKIQVGHSRCLKRTMVKKNGESTSRTYMQLHRPAKTPNLKTGGFTMGKANVIRSAVSWPGWRPFSRRRTRYEGQGVHKLPRNGRAGHAEAISHSSMVSFFHVPPVSANSPGV